MPNEQERVHEAPIGRRPLGSVFEESDGPQGTVHLIHGVHSRTLPLAGRTVGQARLEFADQLHIDPEAQAVVDGREVDEDTLLAEGQVLNFIKRAGERG